MSYPCAVLIGDALAIAKCPGFLAQGGRAFNLVLDDLSQHRNLKINITAQVLSLTAGSNGPLTLESDYLRTYDLFYTVNGIPHFLNPCSLKEFDEDTIQAAVVSRPLEWATDLSSDNLYVYPKSDTNLLLTHRYFRMQPPIVSPESDNTTIPWFPDQDYLVQATAMRMMRITDDARYPLWVQDCEALLRKHLLTEGDEQQVVKSVGLDPRRFRLSSNRPTKSQPF